MTELTNAQTSLENLLG